MIYWSIKAYIYKSSPEDPHVSSSPAAESSRSFGTYGSKSVLYICEKLSDPSTHGSGHEKERQSASAARDGSITDTDILGEHSFIEQASSRVKNAQGSIDDGVNCIPGLLQDQSFAMSRRSSTPFVVGNALERPCSHSDGTIYQDPDDTATMQAMLDYTLAQKAGSDPCFSNFMQGLGFFDEDTPPQGGFI